MDSTEQLILELPSDLIATVRSMMKSGHFASEGELISTILRIHFDDSTTREGQDIETLRALIAESIAEVNAGNLIDANEVHDELEARYRAMVPGTIP